MKCMAPRPFFPPDEIGSTSFHPPGRAIAAQSSYPRVAAQIDHASYRLATQNTARGDSRAPAIPVWYVENAQFQALRSMI